MSLEELENNNEDLFGDLVGDKYETNYANPEYVYNRLLEDMDEEKANKLCKLLSYIVAVIRACIPYAYEQRKFSRLHL